MVQKGCHVAPLKKQKRVLNISVWRESKQRMWGLQVQGFVRRFTCKRKLFGCMQAACEANALTQKQSQTFPWCIIAESHTQVQGDDHAPVRRRRPLV